MVMGRVIWSAAGGAIRQRCCTAGVGTELLSKTVRMWGKQAWRWGEKEREDDAMARKHGDTDHEGALPRVQT